MDDEPICSSNDTFNKSYTYIDKYALGFFYIWNSLKLSKKLTEYINVRLQRLLILNVKFQQRWH